MGQRCNLFVLHDGLVDVYYDHHAANRLDCELFWGPDLALEFVRTRDPILEGVRPGEIPGEQLLDNVWAEGGALIDTGARHLLWFGGDIPYGLKKHMVHLDLMRRAWRGWRVEWAAEGMTTLARAVGVPERDVITQGLDRVGRLTLPRLLSDGEIGEPLLATAQTPDGAIGATLSGECEGLGHPSASPEALLALIEGSSRAPFAAGVPEAGIHLDLPQKFLGCWSVKDQPRLSIWLAERWVGWTTVLWGDDIGEHARLRPDLPWPTVTDADRLRRIGGLEEYASWESRDPVAQTLEVAAALRASGRRVEMSSAVLEGRPSLDAGDRKLAVVAALRREIAQARA